MTNKTKSQLWRVIPASAAFILILALAACTPAASDPSPNRPTTQPAAIPTSRPVFTPTTTPNPLSSVEVNPVTPSPSPATPPPPTATAPAFAVCSPLQGMALTDLAGAITNPFAPPPLGSDDPHQGVDFADRLPGGQIAIEGRPVQAVYTGRVAGVIAGRFPYGNAIFIETLLRNLPINLNLAAKGLRPGTPFPTPAVRSALTCPPWTGSPSGSDISLYLLYAHMQQPPALEAGSAVACGDVLGAVGSSGNALNPHLHLEARLGPAGVKFDSMAHYDTSANTEEMANYCAWRTSGAFLLLDPLLLLSPTSPQR